MPITQGGGGSPLREEGYRREQSATASALGAAGVQTARVQERGQTERAAMERDVNMKALQMQQQQAAWQVRTATEERNLKQSMQGLDIAANERALKIKDALVRDMLTKSQGLTLELANRQDLADRRKDAIEKVKFLTNARIADRLLQSKGLPPGMSKKEIDKKIEEKYGKGGDVDQKLAPYVQAMAVDVSDEAFDKYAASVAPAVRDFAAKFGGPTGAKYEDLSKAIQQATVTDPGSHPVVTMGLMTADELRRVGLVMTGQATEDPRAMAPLIKKYVGGIKALYDELRKRKSISQEELAAAQQSEPTVDPNLPTLFGGKGFQGIVPEVAGFVGDAAHAAAYAVTGRDFGTGVVPRSRALIPKSEGALARETRAAKEKGIAKAKASSEGLDDALRLVSIQLQDIRDRQNMPVDPNNPGAKYAWAGGYGIGKDWYQIWQNEGANILDPNQYRAMLEQEAQAAAAEGDDSISKYVESIWPTQQS